MSIETRKEGIATKRIRRASDGECVGIVYLWDNGDVTTLWIVKTDEQTVSEVISDRSVGSKK
ncbi:hypothetical protein [Roseovarius sp. C03]|uniref:hypothetical protein n=1 Tax=Roseovarius sp. C03 TaxID=3449222 RepID=UPI003EDC23E5